MSVALPDTQLQELAQYNDRNLYNATYFPDSSLPGANTNTSSSSSMNVNDKLDKTMRSIVNAHHELHVLVRRGKSGLLADLADVRDVELMIACHSREL